MPSAARTIGKDVSTRVVVCLNGENKTLRCWAMIREREMTGIADKATACQIDKPLRPN